MDQSNMAKQKYQKLVEKTTPNSRLLLNCIKAFIIGGLLCCLGQYISKICLSLGIDKDAAGMYTSVILIFLGVLFTGFGLYDKLGKFAGAGSIVPITGFANSVAAPAIEFKKEGFILGVGARMFIIAGPVIVYGVLSSVIIGIVYYFMR